MLAAAARDAKLKAIVLKSLAFASLPEREQRGGGPKKPPRSTEYLRYYGVTLGLCARAHPSHSDPSMMMTQIITGIEIVFEKSLLHCYTLCHTVTLSHVTVTHSVVVVVVFCHTVTLSQR